MTRTNFYVLVDKSTETVLNHPAELPENWNNIHGLPSLNDEELADLGWAGHENLGWIKFDLEFPNHYNFADEWTSFAKESIKDFYAKLRWEAETKGIIYKSVEIGTDDRTKTTILLKKELMAKTSKQTFSWKHKGSIVEFNVKDIIEISNAINDYIQECFEIEASLIQQLDAATNPLDLARYNLEIEWPSNVYD